MSEQPLQRTDWFLLLYQAYKASEMSYPKIAQQAQVSAATVYRTLSGRSRPQRDNLWRIASVIADDEVAEKILEAFDTYTREDLIPPAGALPTVPPTAAQIIADAIVEAARIIAEAIREPKPEEP